MASVIRIGAKSGFAFFVDMRFQLSHWDFRSLLGKSSLDLSDDHLKCTQVPQYDQAVLPEGRWRCADVRYHIGVLLLGRAVLAELHPGG